MSVEPPLVPIVAYGARMSWAGILRPGDRFPLPRRSRLASISSESGPGLRRSFGSWSERYQRFTANLSSPRLEVRIVRPEDPRPHGILGFVHWVDRASCMHSGPGSVPAADGWSVPFWDSFVSILDRWTSGTVPEKLRRLLERPFENEPPVLAAWRSLVLHGPVPPERRAAVGWVPIPATLRTDGRATECIVSWEPGAPAYASLSEALSSDEARRRPPDPEAQARYYLECRLSALHGVRFGAHDAIADPAYARSPFVEALQRGFEKLERGRIADPNFGSLAGFERELSA